MMTINKISKYPFKVYETCNNVMDEVKNDDKLSKEEKRLTLYTLANIRHRLEDIIYELYYEFDESELV